jgi:hemimethylated DNA binding protein
MDDPVLPDGTTSKVSKARVLSQQEEKLCHVIVTRVQDILQQHLDLIAEETASRDGLDLLDNITSRLSHMLSEEGGVLPTSYRMSSVELSPVSLAAHYLRALTNISLELLEASFQRKASKIEKESLRFSLGQVVHHKVFDFRGVIVAWDAKPTLDVSRWDGLQHIENPMELPFYHVAPDRGDCIQAFGGERVMRYVCEANLEACDENKRLLDVDLDPEWKLDASNGSYIPPVQARFKHGEDLDDDGVTEQCLAKLQEATNAWQLAARTEDGSAATKLSLDQLLQLLKMVDNLEDAMAVQDLVKEIRKAHASIDVRGKLDTGMQHLLVGRGEVALETFKSITKDNPFPEAYNKQATVEFMLGKMEDSQVSTEKVLELDPLHMQALNGLGLIYFEKQDYHKAAELFRSSIALDPWSPVSSKLAVCLHLLAGAIIDESKLV